MRYFKAFLHISSWNVLYIGASTNLVLALSLLLMTPVIDRAGNKLVLTLSGIVFAIHFTGWACVAAGIVPFHGPYLVSVLVFQALTSGFGAALWNLGNVRMVMGIVPVMGRPHFLALYSVCANVTIGAVPLVVGPVLDYLGPWNAAWGSWSWNAYSLLYCTLSLTIIVGLCVLQTLNEPHKMTWDVFIARIARADAGPGDLPRHHPAARAQYRMKRFLAWLCAQLIGLVGASLRMTVDDRAGILNRPERSPIIIAFWHNRTGLMPYFWWRYCPGRTSMTFISRSRDGQFMTDVAARFGVNAVRGSSSRHGMSAALAAIRASKNERLDLVITPDGPRGPKYQVQPGIIRLAQSTGRPIVPITYQLQWKFQLKSWDGFFVPVPFSKCRLATGPVVSVPPGEGEIQDPSMIAALTKGLGNDHDGMENPER